MNHFEFGFFDELEKIATTGLHKQAFLGSFSGPGPAAPPPVARRSSILPGLLLGGAAAALPGLMAHSGVDVGIAEKMNELPDLSQKFKAGLMAQDAAIDPELVAEKSKPVSGFFFDSPSPYDQAVSDYRDQYTSHLEDKGNMAANLRNARIMSALPFGLVAGGAAGALRDHFNNPAPNRYQA
jgi:hypothetical protein